MTQLMNQLASKLRVCRFKRRLIYIQIVIAIALMVVYNILSRREFLEKDYEVEDDRPLNVVLREYIQVDNGTGCVMPADELYGLSVRDESTTSRDKASVIDCGQVDWVRCKFAKCSPTKETLKIYKDLTCSYADVAMRTSKIMDVSKDKTIKIGSQGYELKESDHVMVECLGVDIKANKTVFWKGTLMGLRKLGKVRTKRVQHYNALVLGFSGFSRTQFVRRLPKTYRSLVEEYKAVVMESHNIISLGPADMLLPVLTGQRDQELSDTLSRFVGENDPDIDEYPFMWKHLKKIGYRTAFLEGSQKLGVLSRRKYGFRRSPTDHYTRVLYYLGAKENNTLCINGRCGYEVMLDLTKQIMTVDAGPKFIMTYFQAQKLSSYNFLDDMLFNFMKHLKTKSLLKNTAVTVIGEGLSNEGYATDIEGVQEERLPLMAVMLPEAFLRRRPESWRYLRNNAKVLTTPFDVHATLLDILGLNHLINKTVVSGSLWPRSMSLIREIPKSRSCSQAGIEPQFCACLVKEDATNQQTNTIVVKKLTDMINNYTREVRFKCKERGNYSVKEINIYKPNKWLKSFKGYKNESSFINVYGKPLVYDILYNVKIIYDEDNAQFDAFVARNRTDATLRVNENVIRRVDDYQTKCLSRKDEKLKKFCLCKV